jgi:hypothetical protein
MKRTTPKNITSLKDNEVFVFGSNSKGKHVGGAARLAFDKFGAVWGQGFGLRGNSYAIPTLKNLGENFPVETIHDFVLKFREDAKLLPEKTFYVTEIGCGIAGFTPEEIAPLFHCCAELESVYLPRRFWDVINNKKL